MAWFNSLGAMPFDPAKRIYWGFLVSSAVIALIVLYLQNKRFTLKSIKRLFFTRSYWFNASSFIDVCYLLGNALFKILVLIPLFGSKLMIAIIVSRFFLSVFDLPPELDLPTPVIMLVYTLVFFVLEDLSRFLLHLALHKIPFLWRFHKVHHSATVLTPLTLHRIHPIEMTLYYARGFIVFGLVVGFFVYLFGSKVSGYDILGVHFLGFIFNAIGANLRHSHVWFGFGFFERYFISPAQHQIHHSCLAEHRDKNFGTCLSLWDTLSNSLVYSGKRKRLKFGLHSS